MRRDDHSPPAGSMDSAIIFTALVAVRAAASAPGRSWLGWLLQAWRTSLLSASFFARGSSRARLSYCAFTQASEPVSLTATSEKESFIGLPSAVPWWSVEMRSGPAFL